MAKTRSVIDWMMDKNRFYEEGTGHITHYVDGEEINRYCLKELSTPGIREAILMRSEKTKQNPLHYIFNNELFNYTEKKFKTKSFISRTRMREIISKVKSLSGHFTTELFEKNLQKSDLKSLEVFRTEETFKLIKFLLAPFDAADADFMVLMTACDNQGETPLHCLFKKMTEENIINYISCILDRISKLNEANKRMIFFTKDNDDNTLLHFAAIKTPLKMSQYLEKMGAESFALAMTYLNKNKETPFHLIFKTAANRDAKELVCDFFHGCPEDLPIFKQDHEGNNVLHYISSGYDIYPSTLDKLKFLLTTVTFNKMMFAQNKAGEMPLHVALKNNKLNIFISLFNSLSPEKRMLLAIKINKNNENFLNLITKYGAIDTLKALTDNISTEDFYLLWRATNKLKKLEFGTQLPEAEFLKHANPITSHVVAGLDALFNLYDYIWLHCQNLNDPTFLKQISTFASQCVAIKNQTFESPTLNNSFMSFFSSSSNFSTLQLQLKNATKVHVDYFEYYLLHELNELPNSFFAKVAKLMLNQMNSQAENKIAMRNVG